MAENGLILSQSEYEDLIEKIHRLQARIAELTALRDDLLYHVCPALQAEYDEKIVSLERELMAANMYLSQMQRTIEILQAQMNQQKKPSLDEAEAQAKRESREFEEDLHRKAEEAREFKEKWDKSRWSEYDRQEKEERERQKERNEEAEDNGSEDGTDQENGTDGDGRKKDGSGKRGSGNDGSKNDASYKIDGDDSVKDEEKGRGSDDDSSGDGFGDSHADGRNDRIGAGDGDGNAAGNGDDIGGNAGKEESAAQRIKRLYRKIVKRLHPDVHPDLTEHEKELWNRAKKAQQEGDLATLERIWDELSGMDAPEDLFEDTEQGRAKLKELLEKLRIRLRHLEWEIDHIKSEFPYTMKSFLEDPAAVEQVRRNIQSKIDTVREMNRKLEAFINELKEKIQKGGSL